MASSQVHYCPEHFHYTSSNISSKAAISMPVKVTLNCQAEQRPTLLTGVENLKLQLRQWYGTPLHKAARSCCGSRHGSGRCRCAASCWAPACRASVVMQYTGVHSRLKIT
jgi:hypothetical protein